MQQPKDVVEGVERHLALYLDATGKLTALLDQENQSLLFPGGEVRILQDEAHKAEKQALYARIETLARIVTRTLETGTPEERATIQQSLVPVEAFRSSLRLNSVLLAVCIERQERRMQRIMQMIESATEETETESRGAPCR